MSGTMPRLLLISLALVALASGAHAQTNGTTKGNGPKPSPTIGGPSTPAPTHNSTPMVSGTTAKPTNHGNSAGPVAAPAVSPTQVLTAHAVTAPKTTPVKPLGPTTSGTPTFNAPRTLTTTAPTAATTHKPVAPPPLPGAVAKSTTHTTQKPAHLKPAPGGGGEGGSGGNGGGSTGGGSSGGAPSS
jgi:uncharacterized membrane protein YgcG